jgi:hypothetical protein
VLLAIHADDDVGRLLVSYSRGVRDGDALRHASCRECSRRIGFGEPLAVVPAEVPGPQRFAHVGCVRDWNGKVPTGLSRLRCEDADFIYSVTADGEPDRLLLK